MWSRHCAASRAAAVSRVAAHHSLEERLGLTERLDGVGLVTLLGCQAAHAKAGFSKLGCVGAGSGSLVIMISIGGDDLAHGDAIFQKTPNYCKDASGLCRWSQACMFFFLALLVMGRQTAAYNLPIRPTWTSSI